MKPSQSQKLSPQRNTKGNQTAAGYVMSKDYGLLFELVCDGIEVPAVVDYRFADSEQAMRDICRVKRFEPYDIKIGVRGMCYAAVFTFWKDHGTELELFERVCQINNLEFFDFTLRNSASSAVNRL